MRARVNETNEDIKYLISCGIGCTPVLDLSEFLTKSDTFIDYSLPLKCFSNNSSLDLSKVNYKDPLIISATDGVGTKIQFLIERLNISVVEGRISAVNNNFDAYELKLDKLCRRLDILEQNLTQYFQNK